MPRNGSGIFERIYSWEDDAANNIRIRADRMDNEMDGMATALSNSIAVDGQTTITGNLPMSGFKHTNVADATQSDQYAALGQVQNNVAQWGGTDTGAADAYEISPTPVVTAYAAGQTFRFKVGTGNTNTGAATLSVNGLPTRNLKDQDGNDPAAGAIREGGLYEVTYDGTDFFLNPAFDYAGDLSVQKQAATISLGKGGFSGPHTFEFYESDGTVGIAFVYATASNELTAELADGTELLKLDQSGNLTVSGDTSVGGDLAVSGALTQGGSDVLTEAGTGSVVTFDQGTGPDEIPTNSDITEPGMKWLASGSVSGGNVQFELPGSDYEDVVIVLSDVQIDTANVDMELHLSADGGSNWFSSGDYEATQRASASNGASDSSGQQSADQIYLTDPQWSMATLGRSNFRIHIWRPASTSQPSVTSTGIYRREATGSPLVSVDIGGLLTTNTSVNRARVRTVGASFTAGSYSVYGRRR